MTAATIFDVSGRVALITGAATGLGRAMAEALAESGARVVLFDQDEALLSDAVAMFKARGAEVIGIAGDVADADALTAAAAHAIARFGRIDVAIANAGISDPDRAMLHETSVDGWQRVVDVNLTGVFNTCHAVLPGMMQQGSGKIINVASMWGLTSAAGLQPRPAYAATKGAVVNLTREIAVEYAPYGIQANALCPGFFRTKGRPRDAEQAAAFEAYTPMGRIAEVEEIKGSVLYLASDASSFVTGTVLVIDGGVLAR